MDLIRSEQYFLELLRIFVGNCSSMSSSPTDYEWQEIYLLAQKHALQGIVFDAIAIIPNQQKPPKQLLFRWLYSVLEIEKKNKLLNIRAEQLTEMLVTKHIDNCILKGQPLALYYPNPLRRVPGDIDIWLQGGRKNIVNFLKNINIPTGEIVYHHVDAEIFDDVDVEIHFRPSWLWNPVRNYRLQKWFKKEASVQMHNVTSFVDSEKSIYNPTRDFNAVYLLLHIYRHFFDEGIGLRQLTDYYFCIKKPGNNAEVRKELAKFGLLDFASAMMFVQKEVFGLSHDFFIVQPDSKRGRVLLNEILHAGNFGRHDTRVSQNYQKRTLGNLFRKLRRNLRFFLLYPDELIWELPFAICHFLWRLMVNRKKQR